MRWAEEITASGHQPGLLSVAAAGAATGDDDVGIADS
jgi:hypothetical protein